VTSIFAGNVQYFIPVEGKGKRSNTCYSAPLQASPTTEALRYVARTKQRCTYLPYTFPAIASTHLPTPKGWRVE